MDMREIGPKLMISDGVSARFVVGIGHEPALTVTWPIQQNGLPREPASLFVRERRTAYHF
jgi:hypothetical protein